MSSLLEQWQQLWQNEAETEDTQAEIELYYTQEKEAYNHILERNQSKWQGTAQELAIEFGFGDNLVIFTGFLEGAQTSLVKQLNLKTLKAESKLKFEFDFAKLFVNMLNAKAEWLYTLSSWEGVLSVDERNTLTKDFRKSQIASVEKIGRNEPCPCGSGKKFKQCCGKGGTDA